MEWTIQLQENDKLRRVIVRGSLSEQQEIIQHIKRQYPLYRLLYMFYSEHELKKK